MTITSEVNLLKRYLPPRPYLLDVGARDGSFLNNFPDARQWNIDRAPKADGVLKISFDDFNVDYFNVEGFDAIIMREVIYYLTSLPFSLWHTRNLLLQGGYLYIKSANRRSYYHWTGKTLRDRHGEEYTWAPTLPELKGLLRRSGFRIVKSGAIREDVCRPGIVNGILSRLSFPFLCLFGCMDRYWVLAQKI